MRHKKRVMSELEQGYGFRQFFWGKLEFKIWKNTDFKKGSFIIYVKVLRIKS